MGSVVCKGSGGRRAFSRFFVARCMRGSTKAIVRRVDVMRVKMAVWAVVVSIGICSEEGCSLAPARHLAASSVPSWHTCRPVTQLQSNVAINVLQETRKREAWIRWPWYKGQPLHTFASLAVATDSRRNELTHPMYRSSTTNLQREDDSEGLHELVLLGHAEPESTKRPSHLLRARPRMQTWLDWMLGTASRSFQPCCQGDALTCRRDWALYGCSLWDARIAETLDGHVLLAVNAPCPSSSCPSWCQGYSPLIKHLLSRPSLFLGRELIASWHRRPAQQCQLSLCLRRSAFLLSVRFLCIDKAIRILDRCRSFISSVVLQTAPPPSSFRHPRSPQQPCCCFFRPPRNSLDTKPLQLPPGRRSVHSLAPLSLLAQLHHARST